MVWVLRWPKRRKKQEPKQSNISSWQFNGKTIFDKCLSHFRRNSIWVFTQMINTLCFRKKKNIFIGFPKFDNWISKAFQKYFLGISCHFLFTTASVAAAANDTTDNADNDGSNTSDENNPRPNFDLAFLIFAPLEKVAVVFIVTFATYQIVNKIFGSVGSVVEVILKIRKIFRHFLNMTKRPTYPPNHFPARQV